MSDDIIKRLREEVFALSRENELLQEDVDRYRWLKSRLLCADFEYDGGDYKAETVIVFKWPEKAWVSGDLSSAIDAAMAAERGKE
jgi:hypothetical protein